MCDPIFDVINYYILGCHMGMMIIRVYDKIEIETRKREKMTIIELFYMDFYPNCVSGLEFTQTLHGLLSKLCFRVGIHTN